VQGLGRGSRRCAKSPFRTNRVRSRVAGVKILLIWLSFRLVEACLKSCFLLAESGGSLEGQGGKVGGSSRKCPDSFFFYAFCKKTRGRRGVQPSCIRAIRVGGGRSLRKARKFGRTPGSGKVISKASASKHGALLAVVKPRFLAPQQKTGGRLEGSIFLRSLRGTVTRTESKRGPIFGADERPSTS